MKVVYSSVAARISHSVSLQVRNDLRPFQGSSSTCLRTLDFFVFQQRWQGPEMFPVGVDKRETARRIDWNNIECHKTNTPSALVSLKSYSWEEESENNSLAWENPTKRLQIAIKIEAKNVCQGIKSGNVISSTLQTNEKEKFIGKWNFSRIKNSFWIRLCLFSWQESN